MERLLEAILSRLDPVAIYYPTDLDEAGDPKYYGFMSKEGYWYIMKVATAGTIRYYMGNGVSPDLYTTAWTNRASLGYNYPNLIAIK